MKTKFDKLSVLFLILVIFSCNNQEKTRSNAEISEIERIKKHIVTPSVVESERLGTLNYFDGYPSEETVQKVYESGLQSWC